MQPAYANSDHRNQVAQIRRRQGLVVCKPFYGIKELGPRARLLLLYLLQWLQDVEV
jgi:hypothetical protein